ncbi:MAG TPA: hypothetical protein VH413_17075 [Verrucomicrobiae bacterium]|jgi:hypothetical protein|nr:hypothetical protein [Verrucomicrobiae bacterium]
MKTATQSKSSNAAAGGKRWWQCSLLLTAFLLFAVLSGLFIQSYDINKVHFSNDGPLGAMVAEQNLMPRIFTGLWVDLNWLGSEGLAPAPAITTFMRLLSPFTYARILPPASLFIVGLSACFCFRRYKLSPIACILGGLAVGLNSDFLSTSCWGVASQTVGFGAMYVALGLLAGNGSWKQWVRVILAGLAVGIGVMEAYDIGALFSLFIAAFIVFQSLFMSEGEVPAKAGKGFVRVAIVAVFALFISAQALTTLIGTQLSGIEAAKQDASTKQKVWPVMTEWSLPKAETFQIIIPGIFGYRNTWHMYDSDQPQADQYWGIIGEDPNIGMAQDLLKSSNPDAQAQAEGYLKNPNLLWRLIGTGFYMGVPVVVIALWALFQAFRGERSPFTKFQRRMILFWGGATLISLLFSYGKYAPFYQFFYALPYASAIRNPDKFMHVFTWALLIVFAFGVHGLVELYLKNPVVRAGGVLTQFKNWWAKANPFERGWLGGCIGVVIVSFLGWAVYSTDTKQLVAYLQTVAIPEDIAPKVAAFSIHAVGWFVLLLVVTVILLALIFSGQFAASQAPQKDSLRSEILPGSIGMRGIIAATLLGALIVFDLGRAGAPWIVYQDVPYKYADDPIIMFLADKPYEHRVAMLPVPTGTDQMALLNAAYGSHWKQGLFFYNNIQCADVVQEPRVSTDKERFNEALPQNSLFNILRFWALSNTRYILAPGGDFVSTQLDPSGKTFRVVRQFDFVPRSANPVNSVDFITKTNTTGSLAVVEFLGALPRAKLYPNWEAMDDTNTLQTVASQNFDPRSKVIVAADSGLPKPGVADVSANPGAVEINPNYRSKRIEVSADVKVPSVLLLSERYSPKWKVTVDGQPAQLLRCDFILRGVFLTPGKHTVVFHFAPSLTALYVSLTAIIIGIALTVLLIVSGSEDETEEKETPSADAKV